MSMISGLTTWCWVTFPWGDYFFHFHPQDLVFSVMGAERAVIASWGCVHCWCLFDSHCSAQLATGFVGKQFYNSADIRPHTIYCTPE